MRLSVTMYAQCCLVSGHEQFHMTTQPSTDRVGQHTVNGHWRSRSVPRVVNWLGFGINGVEPLCYAIGELVN